MPWHRGSACKVCLRLLRLASQDAGTGVNFEVYPVVDDLIITNQPIFILVEV